MEGKKELNLSFDENSKLKIGYNNDSFPPVVLENILYEKAKTSKVDSVSMLEGLRENIKENTSLVDNPSSALSSIKNYLNKTNLFDDYNIQIKQERLKEELDNENKKTVISPNKKVGICGVETLQLKEKSRSKEEKVEDKDKAIKMYDVIVNNKPVENAGIVHHLSGEDKGKAFLVNGNGNRIMEVTKKFVEIQEKNEDRQLAGKKALTRNLNTLGLLDKEKSKEKEAITR